jgi:hypothetical protein
VTCQRGKSRNPDFWRYWKYEGRKRCRSRSINRRNDLSQTMIAIPGEDVQIPRHAISRGLGVSQWEYNRLGIKEEGEAAPRTIRDIRGRHSQGQAPKGWLEQTLTGGGEKYLGSMVVFCEHVSPPEYGNIFWIVVKRGCAW